MTPERQRIAIAEACDFCDVKEDTIEHVDFDSRSVSVMTYLMGTLPDGKRRAVPRYPECLNAMHEAEKVLTKQQWDDYTDALETVCKCACGWEIMDTDDRRAIVSATAGQRAEAFLKTLNLWSDK